MYSLFDAPCCFSAHFLHKNEVFGLKTTIFLEILGIFWKFLWFFLGFLGHAWTRPEGNRAGPEFGRRGKLTCHRIDELFKPNWPPRPPSRPPRPPERPPQEFFANNLIVQKNQRGMEGDESNFCKKQVSPSRLAATYSPSPAGAYAPAGDGSLSIPSLS